MHAAHRNTIALMPYTGNESSDQPVRSYSLIMAFSGSLTDLTICVVHIRERIRTWSSWTFTDCRLHNKPFSLWGWYISILFANSFALLWPAYRLLTIIVVFLLLLCCYRKFATVSGPTWCVETLIKMPWGWSALARTSAVQNISFIIWSCSCFQSFQQRNV